MQNTRNGLDSSDVSLFNQVAMFSVTGLSLSMAMAVVGNFRILFPWF